MKNTYTQLREVSLLSFAKLMLLSIFVTFTSCETESFEDDIDANQKDDIQLKAVSYSNGDAIALRANVNEKYVAAEDEGSKSLIANRNSPGGWETFYINTNSDGTISLKANANGKYVCADNAGASALIANRSAIGKWEKFNLINNSNGTISLKALANNKYVCADNGGTSNLIANRTAIGLWEQFHFVKLSGNPQPPTNNGGDYPYDFLGLNNWKITVPKDQSGNGKADEVYVDRGDNSYSGDPSFTEYEDSRYFSIEGDWVRFTCQAGAASTVGSSNPRSELREMTSNGGNEIEWDMRSSTLRKLEVTVRITETPSSGKVCFAQIHGKEEYGFDDIIRIQIRSSGAQTSGASSTMYVMGDAVNDKADDIGSYKMGDQVTVRIEAQNSTVKVFVNNKEEKKYTNIKSPANYFKAGAYLQSKPSSGKGVTEFKKIKTTPN